jgi:hypothetical protein
MDLTKSRRAWGCTRRPARPQAFFPARGKLYLDARALAGAHQVLLRKPYVRHPPPIPEGILSRFRLARGAFVCFCRSSVKISFAWLRWCECGAPTHLADSALWISCFAAARWSTTNLDLGYKQMNYPFYYSLTRRSRVQVPPVCAINSDTWDRRIVGATVPFGFVFV